MQLEDEVDYLLSLGTEGAYWDFKSDYPDTREEKLHDIICMANNLENRDAYLIYGAEDDGKICGIENTSKGRTSTKSLIEFLRCKPFASGYVPSVEVTVMHRENHELDVVTIHQSMKTPFYLYEDYKDRQNKSTNKNKIVKAGAIYTRTDEINTPMHTTASPEHAEYLWRKRFGYDMRPYKRMELLLKERNEWSDANWDSVLHSYHKLYPEYQIVAEKHDGDNRSYDQLSYFYDDPTMFYTNLHLMYYSTSLYESELWYMDCGRCIIPKPDIDSVGVGKMRFYYYIKNSVNGNLISWFTHGRYECRDRSGLRVPIMFFEDEEDYLKFKDFYENNIAKADGIMEELRKDAILQHKSENEERICNGKPYCGVFNVAASYEMYRQWKGMKITENYNKVGKSR